jgi:hypothetical protein
MFQDPIISIAHTIIQGTPTCWFERITLSIRQTGYHCDTTDLKKS